MSTKVKGDKIKEGSIPLSALSNEIKDKIENAGGGADWNAQPGEAGYIENKPFYIEQINIDKNDIVWDEMGEGCTVQLSQLGAITIYFEDITDGIFGPLILNEQNEYRGKIYASDSSWDVYLNTDNFVLSLTDGHKVGSNIVSITQDVLKQIDSKYIPNSDWNAKEGEAGFIKNRTHYDYVGISDTPLFNTPSPSRWNTETIEKRFYKGKEWEEKQFVFYIRGVDFIDNVYNNPDNPIRLEWNFIKQNEYIHNLTLSSMGEINVKLTAYEKYNPDTGIEGAYDYYIKLEFISDSGFEGDTNIEFYSETTLQKKIDAKYLPDTVIKTTSQSLSDAEKTQALTNLGIDPVVLKYTINPYGITISQPIPEDLANIIYDYNTNEFLPIIKNVCYIAKNSGIHQYIVYVASAYNTIFTMDPGDTTFTYEYNSEHKVFLIP